MTGHSISNQSFDEGNTRVCLLEDCAKFFYTEEVDYCFEPTRSGLIIIQYVKSDNWVDHLLINQGIYSWYIDNQVGKEAKLKHQIRCGLRLLKNPTLKRFAYLMVSARLKSNICKLLVFR